MTGGSGGDGTITWKDYVDAQDSASRAQNDARFSEVVSKLDALTVRLDALPRPVGFWQLAGLAASVLVVGFTLLALFADRFDGGIAASGLLDSWTEQQKARDASQDERLDKILTSLETLNAQAQQASETSPAP